MSRNVELWATYTDKDLEEMEREEQRNMHGLSKDAARLRLQWIRDEKEARMKTKTVRERYLDGEFTPQFPPEPPSPDYTVYHEELRKYQIECERARVERQCALMAALAKEHGLVDHPKLGLLQELVLDNCWGDSEIVDHYDDFAKLLK